MDHTLDEESIPRLDRDEAQDLVKKLQAFRKHLSPSQQAYLGFALGVVANVESDVRGYDIYVTEYYIGYWGSDGTFYATGEVDIDEDTGGEVELDY